MMANQPMYRQPTKPEYEYNTKGPIPPKTPTISKWMRFRHWWSPWKIILTAVSVFEVGLVTYQMNSIMQQEQAARQYLASPAGQAAMKKQRQLLLKQRRQLNHVLNDEEKMAGVKTNQSQIPKATLHAYQQLVIRNQQINNSLYQKPHVLSQADTQVLYDVRYINAGDKVSDAVRSKYAYDGLQNLPQIKRSTLDAIAKTPVSDEVKQMAKDSHLLQDTNNDSQ